MKRLRKELRNSRQVIVLGELLLAVALCVAGLGLHYSPIVDAVTVIIFFVLANVVLAGVFALLLLIVPPIESRINSHISAFGRAGFPFVMAGILLMGALVAFVTYDSTGRNVVLTAVLIAAGTALIGPLVIAGFVQVAQSMHHSDERRRRLRLNLYRVYYAAWSRAELRPEMRIEWAAQIANDIGATPVGYLDPFRDLPQRVAVGNVEPDRVLDAIRLLDGPGDDEWIPVRERLYYFPFAPIQPGLAEVANLREDIEEWCDATEDAARELREGRRIRTAAAASRAHRLGWTVDRNVSRATTTHPAGKKADGV